MREFRDLICALIFSEIENEEISKEIVRRISY